MQIRDRHMQGNCMLDRRRIVARIRFGWRIYVTTRRTPVRCGWGSRWLITDAGERRQLQEEQEPDDESAIMANQPN